MAKVLVVEDDPFIVMWLEEALLDVGHAVLTATNADQAVVNLESQPDVFLVFTDIDMPGSMDGLQLSSLVRERWPSIKIVVASGKHRPREDEMPPDAVFLPKPYLPSDIVKVVGIFSRAA